MLSLLRVDLMCLSEQTPLLLGRDFYLVLVKARLLTQFDLRSAFNQVVMIPNLFEKTPFVTRRL